MPFFCIFYVIWMTVSIRLKIDIVAATSTLFLCRFSLKSGSVNVPLSLTVGVIQFKNIELFHLLKLRLGMRFRYHIHDKFRSATCRILRNNWKRSDYRQDAAPVSDMENLCHHVLPIDTAVSHMYDSCRPAGCISILARNKSHRNGRPGFMAHIFTIDFRGRLCGCFFG